MPWRESTLPKPNGVLDCAASFPLVVGATPCGVVHTGVLKVCAASSTNHHRHHRPAPYTTVAAANNCYYHTTTRTATTTTTAYYHHHHDNHHDHHGEPRELVTAGPPLPP
jgi:hypothetical protein